MTEYEQTDEMLKKPKLDKKTRDRMEACASSDSIGRKHRVMLDSLTKSLEYLGDYRLSDKAAFDDIKRSLWIFLCYSKSAHETAQTAYRRLELADRCGKESIEACRLAGRG